MKESKNHALRGIICGIIGGVCWGFSGTCGQYLYSHYEINTLWLTCVRLLTAGIILTLVALTKHREALQNIWKDRKDATLLILFGMFGLTLCQYAYMASISHSNAATTTVLQNLSLVVIMLLGCLRSRRFPNRVELWALALALLGTFLLATGGNPTQMVLSRQGLLWGLGAALAVTIYTVMPRKLLEKWHPTVVTGYGMLIGGVALNLVARSWTFTVHLPPPGWLAVAAIVILGTVLSFSFFMQGVADVGPVKTAMLASSEPVAATFFSALWLKTAFSVTDLLGFALIIATIFLLAKSK